MKTLNEPIKPTCAFYDSKSVRCTALTSKNCKKCKFFKTREQLRHEEQKAESRLRSKGLVKEYTVKDGRAYGG